MEIRFIPKEYSELLSDQGLSALPASLLDGMFEDFSENIQSIKFREVNFGPGADWIWIYATIAGVTQLVILGDKINRGLEGWINLANKLQKLIGKCSHVSLDRNAISVLCIAKILELVPEAREIEMAVEFEREVPVGYGTSEKGVESNFIEKAQAYYVLGFEIDSKEFILLGSYMDGKLEVLKRTPIIKRLD